MANLDGDSDAFAIRLTSHRVRDALAIVEGMASGQPASALLMPCTKAKKPRSRFWVTGETPGTTRPSTGLRRSSTRHLQRNSMKAGHILQRLAPAAGTRC